MSDSAFSMRQIHLDFHTSPDIPDVGADWDADHFIHTLTRAHVNSINLIAKCHHGMSYYPTKVGVMHPSLKFDLLGEQIEVCHRAGIRCPIYVSIVWDMSAAERHPEWRQVGKDGALIGRKPFDAPRFTWPWMCVNNGYMDELAAQTEELMARYECDGFFYDILMVHPDGCLCTNCMRELRAAGADPTNPEHRRLHNQETSRRCMARLSDIVRAKLPDASIFYNSRFGFQFDGESQYYSEAQIESLPTGGWGYAFYPKWSRYARNFDLPMIGMTGRFHRSWADWGGLKHPDALRFECAGILATGGGVCIGDQLHPRGRLNEAVYDVIGEALAEVEAVEPYCTGVDPVTQVALLVLDEHKDRADIGAPFLLAGDAADGAAKMLLELHQQFDVITDQAPDFAKYAVIVIPDHTDIIPGVAARLRDYVKQGGRLLLSHEALLEDGPEKANFALADEMGVDYLGPCATSPNFFEITASALHTPVTRAGFKYSLYETEGTGPGVRVHPRPGTEILADVYESYFDRTWEHFSSHDFTAPRAEKAGYPAVTRRDGVVYIYGPIFAAYQKYGSLAFRALVGRCLDLLLPEPVLETDAPASAEVTLNRQGKKNRYVAHVVNYSAGRRAPSHVEVLETPVPLHDVTLRFRGLGRITSAFLARTGEKLPFTLGDEGIITVRIPRVDVSQIVVLE